MNTRPYISAIVPVYNSERTLGVCLESILSQSFRDFELIVVDDGSGDSSSEIIDEYAASDGRVKIVRKENGGVSSARNAGLEAACGRYVCFIDSDDVLPDGALSSLAEACGSSVNVDLVIGGYVADGRGSVFYPPVPGFYDGNISACIDDNYRFRSSLFRAVWGKLFSLDLINGGSCPLRFDERFSYGEDVIFVWSFMMRSRRAAALHSVVYIYSDTPGGLGSGLGSDRHLSQLLRFIPVYGDCLVRLRASFPDSRAVASMYHEDLVGRLVCRALTVFATRTTDLLCSGNIAVLYEAADKDSDLGLFSLRKGQFLNIVLYRIHSPRFTAGFYAFSSRLCTFLHIRPKRY